MLEPYNNIQMGAFGLNVDPMTLKLMLKQNFYIYPQRQLIGLGGGGGIKTKN